MDLPPPLNLWPNFPNVYFDPEGRPVLAAPGPKIDPEHLTTIYQIVPAANNPYILRFGKGVPCKWYEPDFVLDLISDWLNAKAEIVIHEHDPNIRTAGIGHGMARFLSGPGIEIFILREMGRVPDGTEIDGKVLRHMVATVGVSVPDRGAPPACHILPAEWLKDPDYPGLPKGLSRDQIISWIGPPPIFWSAGPAPGRKGLTTSRIEIEVSDREADEGGGALDDFASRGLSYHSLMHVHSR